MEVTIETEDTMTGVVTATRIIPAITREATAEMTRAEAVTTEVATAAGTIEATRRGAGAMTITRDGAVREEAAATERSAGETGEEAIIGGTGGETPETATGITEMRDIVTERIQDTTKRTLGQAILLLKMNQDMARMRTPETEAARVRTIPGRREKLGLMTWSLVI